MWETWLKTDDTRTIILAFDPRLLPQGIYRRSTTIRHPNTKARSETQHSAMATMLKEVLDFDPSAPSPGEESNYWPGFPLEWPRLCVP